MWPAAQRESLFWSHVRQVNGYKDPDALDLFMVCNHDCERPDVPVSFLSYFSYFYTFVAMAFFERCKKPLFRWLYNPHRTTFLMPTWAR